MLKYSLGAKIDKTRTTRKGTFGAIELPSTVITDISMLPVLDQGQQEACVGHAGANGVNYDYYKKNNSVPQSSARWNYGVAKIVDGNLDAGTSATSMFNGWSDEGGSATIGTMPNDVSLPPEQYSNITITPQEVQDAVKYPIKNEVDIANPTAQDLMNLISQYGVALIAVEVDEETWMMQNGNVSLKPGTAGGHEVLLYGYEMIQDDIEFYILNSWGPEWGKNGRGSFLWSDYNGYVYDAMSVEILANSNPMVTVNINRQTSDAKETQGVLTAGLFQCLTLERPWLNNEPNVSCIPPGTYQCAMGHMNDLNLDAYEVQNVPNRSDIFLHPGNFYTDTEGCILLGASFADINGDGEQDVTSSQATFAQFMQKMGGKPFTLVIN